MNMLCIACDMNCVHYFCVVNGFLGFWIFSRNRLASCSLPPGGAYRFYHFWVFEEKPPGGELPTARRRVLESPIFWVLVELPGGDVYPPGDASHIGLIFVFSGF